MLYALMIFIGITIGLIINRILDIRKADVDKVIFEEAKEKKRIQIRYEKILEIKDDAEFKLQTGMKREVFFKILDFLTDKFNEAHKKGSFKGIGVGCRFFLALTYWREYRAMRQMVFDYDVSASTVCTSVKWVKETLQEFKIEDIKTEIEKLENQGIKVENIIGDVEEQPIERPIINQFLVRSSLNYA